MPSGSASIVIGRYPAQQEIGAKISHLLASRRPWRQLRTGGRWRCRDQPVDMHCAGSQSPHPGSASTKQHEGRAPDGAEQREGRAGAAQGAAGGRTAVLSDDLEEEFPRVGELAVRRSQVRPAAARTQDRLARWNRAALHTACGWRPLAPEVVGTRGGETSAALACRRCRLAPPPPRSTAGRQSAPRCIGCRRRPTEGHTWHQVVLYAH